MPPEQPRRFFVNEVFHDGKGTKRLHVFPVTDRNFYRDVTSINAFRTGRRRGASKRDREFLRDRCCWGPHALFCLKNEDVWRQDQEIVLKSLASAANWTPKKAIQCEFGVEVENLDNIPRTTHASIWDFYRAIGFDHTRRRYLGADGKPVKYSVLPPK